MTDRKKILITNDDGIDAPGIRHLWQALNEHFDTSIVAPDSQRSGVGMSLTLHQPITIRPVAWSENTSAWKVRGNPTDCVRFALRILLDHKPDLIVSGINQGSNAGRNVLYSGTIGGVIEGTLRGVPGIAFSCVDFENPNYARTEKYIGTIVNYITEHPLSPGSILNVNFPDSHKEIRGVRMARQGKGLWVEDPDHRFHPDGESYYWHGGIWSNHEEALDSDVALLNEGYVTAVPIHVDQLTDNAFFEERRDHFESRF